jgi:hypothetical protein
LCYLGKAFTQSWVAVTPSSAAFEFIQNFRLGIHTGFSSKVQH